MNLHNKDHIVFHYDMTLACNNRCPYCFKLSELDNDKFFNEKIYNATLNALINFKDKTNYKITVDLIGGDSLMIVDKAIYFMNKLEENNIESVLFTNFNFEKNSDQIKNIIEYCDTHKRIMLNISWHQSSNQTYMKENLKLIKDDSIILFVLSETNINFVYDSILWLKNNTKLNYVVEFIRDNYESKEFTKFDNEKVKYILENSYNSTSKENTNILDNEIFDVEKSKKYDLVNIAKQNHVICQLSQLRIDYYGNISSTCGYHFDGGNIINGIPEIKNVYCNNSCICGTFNYKKIGKER